MRLINNYDINDALPSENQLADIQDAKTARPERKTEGALSQFVTNIIGYSITNSQLMLLKLRERTDNIILHLN